MGVSMASIFFFPILENFARLSDRIFKIERGLVYPLLLMLLYSPLDTNPVGKQGIMKLSEI